MPDADPADRRAPVDRSSAYAHLTCATYLGTSTETAAMTIMNLDLANLPLGGLSGQTSVPSDDTVLTLATTPPAPWAAP